MAALLESLLKREVELYRALAWLRGQTECTGNDQDLLLKVRKQEFVPFLLNFLRDQSSRTLSHGATTPAKTPSSIRSSGRHRLADFMISPPESQPSPTTQQHRGRRRSGPHGPTSASRQAGARSGHLDEGGRWDGAGRKGRGGGRISEPVSPPTQVELNFNSLEDFPPVGCWFNHLPPPSATKPSRRINPTPVSAERPNSKPKSCFTSTPLSQPCSPPSIPEVLGGSPAGSSLCLQQERELLKKERYMEDIYSRFSSLSSEPQLIAPCPDPSKVTHAQELNLLAEVYCACISENLVPCVFLELFFVLQLLTTRSTSPTEDWLTVFSWLCPFTDLLEKAYLRDVHSCVYFAVRVLENQFALLSHLDRCTLRLLVENERVGTFSPALRDRLVQAQDTSTAKVLPFQPSTDNRANFSSDKAFHIFKKQRDIFYELLREWEDCHKEPGWEFEAALGHRVRAMVSQLTVAGNHCHFARLFQKQLVQMCKGPRAPGSPGDAPDADLLGVVGADGLGRLQRLQERLSQPQAPSGPCPPPSFPGPQEFFKDFLQTASCCQLNQHLKDGLCQQLLQLNEVSILGTEATSAVGAEEAGGDMDQQRFSSVLLVARLLAKFLGFISFMPYQTSEAPSKEIQEAAIALRSKSAPVLDVCAVLRSCVRRRRTVLTVPWLVEFLSMLDHTGPSLPCYRTALCLLLQLYRQLRLGKGGEQFYMNHLLLMAVLGWLFQVKHTALMWLEEQQLSTSGLNHSLPSPNSQLLYTCCPYLGEFRKLLAAFVSGSASKAGGLIRKITPTSAELPGPSTTRSQQKLHQAFFHNQPPSLRRTVEFVAERVGSNCVKHIKATLVSELVRGGENALRDGLASEGACAAKLNDSLCAQLCDAGMQALERATRFCGENAPRAVSVLLPEETSHAVLTTAESITTRLATEKACNWLSSNITTLIKREWKSSFERITRSVPCPDAGSACPPDCTHKAPLASDVIIEIKVQEVLSIATGPRSEEEVFTAQHICSILNKVAQTLSCRKVQSLLSLAEQMLLRCTVLLACKLVSGDLPLVSPAEIVRSLLDEFVLLWAHTPSGPIPFHILLSEATITRRHYLLLVKLLIEKHLLKEEEIGSQWAKMSELSWPVVMVSYIHTVNQTSIVFTPCSGLHQDIGETISFLPVLL
uniref:Codanin-1 C-terminal domain-containing protein n=1 Tax=Electrophorus electricus TaxID=8005 RepID=A0AAY5EZM1_ELEEL